MNRDPFGLGFLLYGARVPIGGMTPVLLASGGHWGITDPVDEKLFGMAHEGCSLTTFCRNPLHPGPCKGWKKKLGVEAPGALKAIESAHKEKLAAKRAKVSEAKSAAEKALTGRQLASPLHAKKAKTKQANILLGDNEDKASGKAAKVILNKAEIKKYSKIKAAHVNSIRTKLGQDEDPGLEDRLAEAFAEDNKSGKDDAYRAAIRGSAESLGAQLAKDHCHKGNHKECDDEAAFGKLRDHLADLSEHALLTGDDEQLTKALADFDAGKLDIPAPAAPKAKIPQGAKSQALADAQAKADAEAKAAAEAAKPKKKAKAAPAPLEGNAALADKGMKFGLGIGAMLKGNKTLGTKAEQKAFADKLEKFHNGDGPDDLMAKGAESLAHAVVWKPSKAKLTEPFIPLGSSAVKAAYKDKIAKEIEQGLKGEDGPTPYLDMLTKVIKAQQNKDWDGAKQIKAELDKMTADLMGVPSGTKAADEVGATPDLPAAPFNVTKAEQLFDPSADWGTAKSQKLALLDDMTPEEYGQLSPKTKAAVDKLITETAAGSAPAMGDIAKKIQTKLGIGGKGGPVGKAIDFGLTDEEAVSLSLGTSQEQWDGLTPAQKAKLLNQIEGANEYDHHHGEDSGANEALNHLAKLNAAKTPTDATAPEPDVLQELMDAVPFVGTESNDVKMAKQALAADGVPEWQLKQQAEKLGPDDWKHFSPDEQAKLKAALASAPPKPYDPYATPPGQITMPDGTHADLHAMFGPDGDPDHKAVTDAVSVMSQDDYDSLSASEKDMLDAHLDDIANYVPGGGSAKAKIDAFKLNAAGGPAAPGVLTPEAQEAKDVAHGVKSMIAKKKLVTYEKVSGKEFEALDADSQKLILADLMAIKDKFADPKKKQQAQNQHDYLSGHMGGGTGAGGAGPAAAAGPGDADLGQAMKDLHGLAELTKAPGGKIAPEKEMQDAYQGFVNGLGHEAAAKSFSEIWADNALKALDDMHGDTAAGGYTADALALAKPALAADIKKKLLGQPGPTPLLDKFKQAKAYGDPIAADEFMTEAIKGGNPGLPGPDVHKMKAQALSKLWSASAPGYKAPTPNDLEDSISKAGVLGYNTPSYDAFTKQQSQKLAAGVMGGGFDQLGLSTGDKVGLLQPEGTQTVLAAITAEMQQAVKDGASAHPKGGYVEQFHDAVKTANQAGNDLASKNGWAVDSPVVQEYKKTIMSTKLDEMADKINNSTPAVHPTGGAGAGGTGGSGSGKVNLGSGTKSGFTNEQNQVITGTLKSQGINLSTNAQTVWDTAVAAAAAHQGKDGFPTSLTVLDILNATDEGHAKNLGVANSNLLRKKVVDWLGTPAGKKYAEDNSTPKPTLMGKLTGELSIKLPPGQKVQTVSGPGPYDASNTGPWAEKKVAQAFADQHAAWEADPATPWNTSGKSYLKPGWKTKWTDDQLDGLYSYTLGSGTINGYLRGETAHASHSTKQTIINIQSAMMPLKEDHLLKRGTGWEQFPPGFRDPESVKQLIGKNITEKAFLSTSVPGDGSAGFGGAVRMEIEAPAGTHAAFVEGLSAFKGGKEQEMLLAAGQVMRVLSVKKDGHQTVVRVRIVTPK